MAGARRRSSSASESFSSTLVLDPTAAPDRDPAVDERAVDATDTSARDLPDASPVRRTKPARSTVTEQPEENQSSESTRGAEAGRERRASSRLWVPAIAATLALAVLAASLVYALRPVVSDTDRTAAVGSARTTLESLLSYSGSSFDKHVGEVTPELASPFKDQFTKVAATDIKPMAVKNDATVQAKVYDAGVMDANGDGGDGTTVRVMAFVNQATTTKAQPTPAIDQNRVIATMRKVGDRWLISELSAY